MRKHILPIIICLAALACSEDDEPQPPLDPFVGSWSYSNQDMNMEVSFDVTKESSGYAFKNITVNYDGIPENATESAELHESSSGPGNIQINVSWSETCQQTMFCDKWLILSISENEIQEKTVNPKTFIMQSGLIRVNMINRVPIELENQILVRKE